MSMDHEIEEWVKTYANAIYALAYSRVGDYHQAQDIVQETFLKAYLNRRFLQDKTKVGSWLYTIAARTSADWYRAKRIRSVSLHEGIEIASGWSAEEIILNKEIQDNVWQTIHSLDEKSRTVFVLFHMSEWSLQEIGEFLKIGVKTVDSRLRRAREKLRDQWMSTVETELRARRPTQFLHQKLLKLLSDGSCDRLIVKEGLQLTGSADGVYALTAKRYTIPFLLDLTAKTDSTNIRLRFAKGDVIFNWEHNPDVIKYNDPVDGTSEQVFGFERLGGNDWARIQWYIGEKISVVLVNGNVVHAVRSNYSGLSGQVGIGPAWSSIVTVKSFHIQESPKFSENSTLGEMIKENQGERINIRMLARWAPDRFNAIRKSFEASRPHLMTIIESVSSPTNILERARSNDAPDLIPLRPQDIAPMLEQGLILDLMPFADREPDLLKEIFPGVLDNCMFGGKLAVIPFEPRIPGILYKKDRFDEEGIPYPTEGWSWDEFLETAIRLTKWDSSSNAVQYGLVIQKDWTYLESMILSNGGSILSPDGKKAVGYLDGDASVDAVQRYVDLYRVHRVAPIGHDPILQPFNFYNEKIGMFGEGSWMAQEGFIKPDNRMGTVGMPVMPGGVRGSAILVSGYAISAKSKYPELTWDLLKRLVRPDQNSAKDWARHNVAWSKTMAELSGQSMAEYFGPFLSELPYARKRMQTLNPKLLYTSLTNEIINDLIVSGADVRQTLEELARVVEIELEEMA